MANFCVRYGNLVFVMANSKNVVFFMVKNRCVRYGYVRYDGTPAKTDSICITFSTEPKSVNQSSLGFPHLLGLMPKLI